MLYNGFQQLGQDICHRGKAQIVGVAVVHRTIVFGMLHKHFAFDEVDVLVACGKSPQKRLCSFEHCLWSCLLPRCVNCIKFGAMGQRRNFVRKIRRMRYELVVSETGFGFFHGRKRGAMGLRCDVFVDFSTAGVGNLL